MSKDYDYSPSIVYAKSKWVLVYGHTNKELLNGNEVYTYNLTFRVIDSINPYNLKEYYVTLSKGYDYSIINKVGYDYVSGPRVDNEGNVYVLARLYNENTGYDLYLIKFDPETGTIKKILVDNNPGDQGFSPDTSTSSSKPYLSFFNLYKNIYTSTIVNNKILLLYSNETEAVSESSKITNLYYAIIDLDNEKIIRQGIISTQEKEKHRFYPRVVYGNGKWLITWRDKKGYYHLTVIDLKTNQPIKSFVYIYSYAGRLTPLYIDNKKEFLLTSSIPVKNYTIDKPLENIYLLSIDAITISPKNGLTPAVHTYTDNEYGIPVYLNNNNVIVLLNNRKVYDSNRELVSSSTYLTVVKPYIKYPPTIKDLLKTTALKQTYIVTIIVKNSGTKETTITNILIDNKEYYTYEDKVFLENNLPLMIKPGETLKINIELVKEGSFTPGRMVKIELITSSGVRALTYVNLP